MIESHASARPLIAVTVIGQEGDEQIVEVNAHQKCEQLLREGLKALYGSPSPNMAEYDLVFNGKVIEPLSQTIAEAGIVAQSTVTILPKTISRGGC